MNGQTRSDGVTLISIYHFISGALSLLGGCGAWGLPMLVGGILSANDAPEAPEVVAALSAVAALLSCIGLLVALANLVVGWGLWRQREWARIGALALAVFRLFNIPLGTIVGIVIIWYLLRDDVVAEFRPPSGTELQPTSG